MHFQTNCIYSGTKSTDIDMMIMKDTDPMRKKKFENLKSRCNFTSTAAIKKKIHVFTRILKDNDA